MICISLAHAPQGDMFSTHQRDAFWLITEIIAFLCIAPVVNSAEQCWVCDNVRDIATCKNTTINCGADEECFLAKYINDYAETRYSAGCSSRAVCQALQALAHGRRSLDQCGQCCTGSQCQANLCGLQLSVLIASNETLPTCLYCPDLVVDAYACKSRKTCLDTEMCSTAIHLVGGRIRYEFGCSSKSLCAALAGNAPASNVRSGNSGVTICSTFCVGNDCNRQDCYTLQSIMTSGIPGTSHHHV
ncbi:uncharacterized protein LOC117340493 [Pecten maximus]|uniref:uncharacterized protein LOC117340493 n=1 Tax=Pecten maximus TaxID=6579 RepID=UPI001459023D|nr:uncharacterized protein LOC117340493 [Pecten maximus]